MTSVSIFKKTQSPGLDCGQDAHPYRYRYGNKTTQMEGNVSLICF